MAHIVSPSNPAAIAEVDATSKAQRVIMYDAAGNVVGGQQEGVLHSSWAPDPSSVPGADAPMSLDQTGALNVRGISLTDEGSLQACFDGVSLSTALTGTLTVDDGSASVVGAATSFATQVKAGQYIKLAAHTESAWTQVKEVLSNTALTLVSPYLGADGTGAALVSDWTTSTATGSITVGSSLVSIAMGTSDVNSTFIARQIDFQPLQFMSVLKYTPGVGTTQTAWAGFMDNPAAVVQQAIIQFDPNLPPNQLWIVTSNTASAQETRKTLCTLPPGVTVNQWVVYRLTVTQTYAVLEVGQTGSALFAWTTIGNVLTHLPGPYAVIEAVLGVTASVGVSQSAVLASDVVYVNNSNRVEVAFSFPGTLLQTLNTPSQQSGAEDMTSKPRGSPDVIQLTSPQPNYMLGRTKIAVGGVGEDRGDASDNVPLPVKVCIR